METSRLIIGIAGFNGAGKTTAAQYLRDKHGFKIFSVRTYIVRELDARGMEHSRENMRQVANEVRKERGSHYFFEQMIADMDSLQPRAIIESLRTVSEVEALKEMGGTLLVMSAPREVRFARIKVRKSETDHISFEEFVHNEEKESHSTNPHKQNLTQVAEQADYLINNTDTEDLYADLDRLVALL